MWWLLRLWSPWSSAAPARSRTVQTTTPALRRRERSARTIETTARSRGDTETNPSPCLLVDFQPFMVPIPSRGDRQSPARYARALGAVGIGLGSRYVSRSETKRGQHPAQFRGAWGPL